MDEFAILQSTPLFRGLSAADLDGLLGRLGAVRRSYNRGAVLVQAGQPSHSVGVVLAGAIEAARLGPDGSRLPITRMGPGGVFGDVLGGSSLTSPVTVTARAPCEVLLIPYDRLLRPEGSAAGQRPDEERAGGGGEGEEQNAHRDVQRGHPDGCGAGPEELEHENTSLTKQS